jgi:hypothetical protein
MSMRTVAFDQQLAALRGVVFEAVDGWNAAHPQTRGSQRERGSINVTQAYTDAAGAPDYSITINCALCGASQLTFHGPDPAALAEQARLVVERKMTSELQRREDEAYEGELNRKFGIAV